MSIPAPDRARLALLAAITCCCGAIAQNPSVDHPHRRPADPPRTVPTRITAADPAAALFTWRGLDRLTRGLDWLARQDLREALHRDPDCSLAHLGMALARRETAPRSAAREAWLAWEQRAEISATERALVTALARCFDARSEPDRLDQRFAEPPAAERLEAFAAALRDLDGPQLLPDLPADAQDEVLRWVADDVALNTGTTGRSPQAPPLADTVARILAPRDADDRRARFDAHLLARSWCRDFGGMPYEITGYVAALEDPAQRVLLPRHPHWPTTPTAQAVVRPDDQTSLAWQPRHAPGYDLPRGLGGRRSLRAHAGRPVLVVFFLGFGCVHCIEQLHALMPYRQRFADAGIDLVTIGTDSVDQVRASYQMAAENDEEPIPFDVLCDPEGAAFKRWLAWDAYLDEALHGTFLVDPEGRILWQDISIEPFMETGFLLAECQRLLEVWKDR